MASPSQIEKGNMRPDEDRQQISTVQEPYIHSSGLPNALYILSFAPPVPSLIRQPAKFFSHPLVLYTIGGLAALVAGLGLPAFDIVTGYWTNGIKDRSAPPEALIARGSQAGWIMTMVGAVFVLAYGTFVVCFTIAGVKLSNLVREQYLSAVISQDQAFFDRVGSGEIASRASKDIDSIRTGLGDRLGYLIWASSTIISAFVSAFVHVPRLAGVLFALIPFTMAIFIGVGWWTEAIVVKRVPIDGQLSSFTEQLLSSIRIVHSFDMGKPLLLKLENSMLKPLRRLTRKIALVKALEQASAYGAGFLVYSLAFWYGSIEVTKGAEVGDVLTTFYNYVNLFFGFATMVPHLIATTSAISAIGTLRLQIERKPPMDVRDPHGIKLDPKTGWEPSFELKNVTFAYPSRATQKALDDVSIHIQAGRFTALAGPSGSGKSTLAALLMRMYDPETATVMTDADDKILQAVEEISEREPKTRFHQPGETVQGSGSVLFAGHDIRDLNLKWLRSQVSVVLQNPQLVNGTVFHNIAIGLTNTSLYYDIDAYTPEALEKPTGTIKQVLDRVEEALRIAQAWHFVQELPDGLWTKVSSGRTGALSGGQVQRVALARALVRQPRCLLLDEATSAVSADTELQIQEALAEEQRRRGMTLIVIAHRLSTIAGANEILVMRDGRLIQSGTYDELTDPNCPDATFRSMVNATSVEQLKPTESETSSTQAGSIHEMENGKMIAAHNDNETDPLPPAWTTSWQAFKQLKWLMSTCIVLGVISGAALVIAAWIHGRALNSLNNPNFSIMRPQVDRWALWFLILALVSFCIMLTYVFGLEDSSEIIVSDLKRESLRALITHDVPFFEKAKEGPGGLAAAVTTNASAVGNFVGLIFAQVVMSWSNLLATLIMAFILEWRLAIMVLPSLFVCISGAYISFRCLKVFEGDMAGETDRQANFVADSVNSVQTIASLTREQDIIDEYRNTFLSRPLNRRFLFGGSFAMAISQSVINFFAALMYWWGAKQLAENKVGFANLFTVIEAVVIAVYVCAKVLTYAGDFTRMFNSMRIIQASQTNGSVGTVLTVHQGWIDGASYRREHDDDSSTITTRHESTMEGIELRDVELRYPTRPNVLALDKVSIRLEPGKAYAFAGTSGAGKSSILAILQRFYQPTGGAVLFDGEDMRNLSVKRTRAAMGYVSQEAVLFEGTVRWNLVAGIDDPASVTQAAIEKACEQARILSFIQSLPEGFETDLGMKGSRLSGGQRQRICIARALLRQPKILLLDEATSALDRESEAYVQQALDSASRGRMTITIGHRLSAIRNADAIFVMAAGKVVEVGTHDDLVEAKGRYFELVQAQL